MKKLGFKFIRTSIPVIIGALAPYLVDAQVITGYPSRKITITSIEVLFGTVAIVVILTMIALYRRLKNQNSPMKPRVVAVFYLILLILIALYGLQVRFQIFG